MSCRNNQKKISACFTVYNLVGLSGRDKGGGTYFSMSPRHFSGGQGVVPRSYGQMPFLPPMDCRWALDSSSVSPEGLHHVDGVHLSAL